MAGFLRYAVLRSLYVLLALAADLGLAPVGAVAVVAARGVEHPAVHWCELPRLHEEMKPELIAGGAHVVPYGIYRPSSLLNSFFHPRQGWERFLEQHPEYVPVERQDGQPVRDLPG
jgi:hypothetical protein